MGFGVFDPTRGDEHRCVWCDTQRSTHRGPTLGGTRAQRVRVAAALDHADPPRRNAIGRCVQPRDTWGDGMEVIDKQVAGHGIDQVDDANSPPARLRGRGPGGSTRHIHERGDHRRAQADTGETGHVIGGEQSRVHDVGPFAPDDGAQLAHTPDEAPRRQHRDLDPARPDVVLTSFRSSVERRHRCADAALTQHRQQHRGRSFGTTGAETVEHEQDS
jgi:hypothetical protein